MLGPSPRTSAERVARMTTTLSVALSVDLRSRVEQAAQSQQMTTAEWVRRALVERLGVQDERH